MRMTTPALPPLPEPDKKLADLAGIALEDFSKPTAMGKKRPMLHTPFVGACTICNLTGSIDVDPVDFKTLDRVLDGRVVKVRCPRCRKETEFRPLKPEEIAEEQFWMLKRQLEIKEKIFSSAARNGMSVPDHIQKSVEEYMKRLGHRLDQPKPGEVAPVEKKIVIPE